MQYSFLAFLLIVTAASLLITVISKINAKRKRLAALKAAFGRPPAPEDTLQFESIGRYRQYIQAPSPSPLCVDRITWNDLDMDRVFQRINACQTSIGEEYLYNSLHQLPLNNKVLARREGLLNFFAKNPDTRLAVQALLASRLGKENDNGLTALMSAPDTPLLKHRHVYTVLAALPLAMAAFMVISLPMGAIGVVASFIVNMMVYYRVKHHIAIEIPSIKYLTNLLRCCKGLGKIKALEALPVMQEIRQHYRVLKPIKRNVPAMSSMAGDLLDVFFEYINIMFLYDIRNYNRFMLTIKRRNREFRALYRAVGELDMSISVLSFRLSLPFYTLPEFCQGREKGLAFTDIYHPLLPSPVANSGVMGNNSIITGSNASGKSTFIKALAINGILAQAINTCAARAFRARYSVIVTSMVMRDDLSAGDSYFIVEIKSLKRIMDLVKLHPCTCYIDEILRGTNTVERIAASASVLGHLSGQDALCIAASHDIELTRILAGKYDNYHFREQVTDDGIVFDYKLKDGPSTTRNAIKLLDFMGFEGPVVQEAEKLAELYARQGAW